MLSGRWHDSHFCWKIGAMSLVNVGVLALSAATAGIDDTRRALKVSAAETRNITGSFSSLSIVRLYRTLYGVAGPVFLSQFVSFRSRLARFRLLFSGMSITNS